MKPIKAHSSLIQSFTYNPKTYLLTLNMQDGRIRLLAQVPHKLYKAFKASSSKGRFYLTHIDQQYADLNNLYTPAPANRLDQPANRSNPAADQPVETTAHPEPPALTPTASASVRQAAWSPAIGPANPANDSTKT